MRCEVLRPTGTEDGQCRGCERRSTETEAECSQGAGALPVVRAGGPATAGEQAFWNVVPLQIRRMRLVGGAVGRTGSRKFYLVSQGGDVDVASAHYFPKCLSGCYCEVGLVR